MTRKTPEREAADDYLRENGRSPAREVVVHAMRHVDPAKALRFRTRITKGVYPVQLSQQVLVGQRNIAVQAIDNAVRRGTIVRHDDDTLELSERP